MLYFTSASDTEPSAAKGVVSAGYTPPRSTSVSRCRLRVARSWHAALMQILKRSHFGSLVDQGLDSQSCRVCGRKRCDAGNVMPDCGAPDGFFVVERFAAERRVDDQINLARLHEVDDVWATFVHLEHGFRFNSRSFQRRRGAARREEAESEFFQSFAEWTDLTLVAVVDAEEDCAFERQALTSSELCFCECLAVGGRNAHDFTGRSHFGAENRVDAAEFAEGKDGRFHRVKIVD